ncbi:unnamed protein product [Boreogadus saida]
MRRIHDQHASEKAAKDEKLVEATCVALTGDHWTSVKNDNYLGVTVHLIDASRELISFALAGDGEHLELPPNQRDGGHLAAGRRKARSHYKRGYKQKHGRGRDTH